MHEKMSPKERILAAYNLEPVDRPPVCPNLFRWIRGNCGCTCELHQLKKAEEFGFDPLIVAGMYLNHPICSDYIYRPDPDGGYRDLPNVNIDIRVENYDNKTIHTRKFETPEGTLTDIIEWARPNVGYGDGPNPHRVEPLAKSLDDLAALKYLYPSPRESFVDDLKILTEMVGDRGLVEYCDSSNAGGWGMESLGPENMLICAAADKNLLKAILRVSQDQHLRNLKTVLESGHKNIVVSWFQCGPSVGWSPDNINEFFLPLIQESVELVHSYDATYRFQDDGKMAGLIPKLIEMGVNVAGALQPPPVGDCVLTDLKAEFGSKICLFGGMDPIYTFEFGTPETVREAVADILDEMEDSRGIVLSTGEAFGPETPAGCLYEWVRAVKQCTKC